MPTPGDLLICAKDLFVDATTVCRDAAGVHYRSDSARGLFVGERSGSCDYSRTYNERFDGFVVRKFNGEKVKIASGEVRPL